MWLERIRFRGDMEVPFRYFIYMAPEEMPHGRRFYIFAQYHFKGLNQNQGVKF